MAEFSIISRKVQTSYSNSNAHHDLKIKFQITKSPYLIVTIDPVVSMLKKVKCPLRSILVRK